MTLLQLKMFVAAIQRLERRKLREALLASRSSQIGKRAFDKLWDSLND